MADDIAWEPKPGQRAARKELQERYGGRTQGGIGPSKKTPNVLIFSDPASGEQHGYYDGWQPDAAFHYTGEGQRGDQRMLSGNRSIRDHEAEGRALRVFKGARGEVEYVGEFVLDAEQPWYETDAPETGGGPLRKVIVFRLRPVDTEPPATLQSKIADVITADVVEQVPIEEHRTEKTYVEPDREPYEAERRESALVRSLATYLRGRDHDVCRQQIVPKGEFKPLFTDLFDLTADLLVEAKGSVTRESIRMAIGQLADYSRFLPTAQKAILVPSRPRSDLEELARSQSIDIIWVVEGGFAATDNSLV
jgi:hypothetical protein